MNFFLRQVWIWKGRNSRIHSGLPYLCRSMGSQKEEVLKQKKKVEAINESESLPSKKIRNSMGILIRN